MHKYTEIALGEKLSTHEEGMAEHEAVYAYVFIHYNILDSTKERATPTLPEGWKFMSERMYTDKSIEFFRRYPVTGSYMGPRESALEAREAVTDAIEKDIESGAIEKYTFHTRAQFEVEYEEWKIKHGNQIENDMFDYFFLLVEPVEPVRGGTGTVKVPTRLPLFDVLMMTHTMACSYGLISLTILARLF
jgi:hypothetical protein